MTDGDTTDDSTDPLADAEPGETVTIEREIEVSPWYLRAADDWVGRDRELESRLELVATEDIGEQGDESLRATYRAEVTKLEEPDELPGAPVREKTGNRWLSAIALDLLAAGAVSAFGGGVLWLMDPITMTVEGETATVATDPMLAALIWVVLSLSIVILHGIQGGFPRIEGGDSA
jgi:hypothetical protein